MPDRSWNKVVLATVQPLLTAPMKNVVAHDGIGEEDLAEHRVAGHFPQRTDFDAGLVHVEREPADALVLGDRRICAGEQHAEIGEVTAPEVQTFWPLMIQTSPSRARQGVERPTRSDPAPGSLNS